MKDHLFGDAGKFQIQQSLANSGIRLFVSRVFNLCTYMKNRWRPNYETHICWEFSSFQVPTAVHIFFKYFLYSYFLSNVFMYRLCLIKATMYLGQNKFQPH
jgi:hypothetical protein